MAKKGNRVQVILECIRMIFHLIQESVLVCTEAAIIKSATTG